MSDQSELAVVRQEAMPIEPTRGQIMMAIAKSGVTKDNAEAMRVLAELQYRDEDRRAEMEFNKAFVLMQAEIPKIRATKPVPNDDGSTRYAYAPFEEIDKQARPICQKFGFSYSFCEGQSEAGKVTKVITLFHIGGHKRSNSYSVRIGAGPPKTSDSQKDGSAHTYAKRGALCDCLAIVVEGLDNDARIEGSPITKDQAAELRKRVQSTGSDEADFLKYAGAKTYEEIASSKLGILDRALKKKENTTK